MNKITTFATELAILCLTCPFFNLANVDADEFDRYNKINIEMIDVDNYTCINYDDIIDLDDFIINDHIESITDIDSNTIVTASAQTLVSILDNNKNDLKNNIESGIPLIVEGESNVLQNIGISVVTNPNANYSAIYCDPISKIIYCYGIESSESNAEDIAIAWINSVRTSAAVQSNSDIDYGNVIFYQETKVCDGDRGRINATATYSKLGTSNGFTFYLVEYNMEAIAKDSDWSIADMTVSCDVDAKSAFQHLIDYGPDSTVAEKSTEVSVSLTVGAGLSIGVSRSWSYSVPSTVIHNQCDTSEDYFSIWHDTDEDTADNTVRVKPGMIVSTNIVYSVTSAE